MSSAAIVLPPLLLVQSVTGAAPQAPAPFPIGPEASNGTARIEGVVTRDGTGEPIPRATVSLTSFRNPNDPAALVEIATDGMRPNVRTDAGGRFVIDGVAPGEYRITAFRNGFVRQEFSPGDGPASGAPVELTAGQTFEAALEMTPAAIIAGRVYDAFGDPVPRTQVRAMQPRVRPDGQTVLESVRTATTNDRGEYRLFWLNPGEYVVNASTSRTSPMLSALTGAGAGGAGSNVEPVTEPMAAFYPGVSDEALAAPVRVGAGEERAGIDVPLAERLTFTVSGRVAGPAGITRGPTFVLLRPADSLVFSGIPYFLDPTPVDAEGNFVVRNVTPGTYTLSSTAQGIGGRNWTASVGVEITNRDLENVALVLAAETDVVVNVFVEEAATAAGSEAVANLDWTDVDVALRGDGMVGSLLRRGQPSDAEGGYLIENVPPGEYLLGIPLWNQGLYLKRVMAGADEIPPGDRITIPPGFTGPLSVLLSPNGGRIDGVASTPGGDPAPNAAVTLLPLDMSGMTSLNWNPTERDGSYSLSGVAPGEYRLFAWDATEGVPFQNAEFIRRFETRGKRIVIREGDALNVNLEAIPESEIR